jgi:ABC-type sugar transport system substrate-binding protein
VILEGGPPAANIEGLETTFVAAETVEAGEIAVENLLEGLEKAGTKSGKIMIVTGIKGAEATIGYQKGISAALAKNPQFEIATEVDGEWEPVKASQATQPLLAKYGSEIVGIISMSGSMAAATADTAEQAGLTVGFESGDTVVSGINCDSTSIESIEQDKMFSTTSQGPVGESEESFNVGSEILAGKEVPLESIPDSPPIFKSNVAKFKSECTY